MPITKWVTSSASADRTASRGGEKDIAKKKKTKMTLDDFFSYELPILSDVVTFCNNLPISLYADSTGVKSPEAVFRGLALSKNGLLAQDYLLNFRRSKADLGVVIGTNNYRLPMATAALLNRELEEREEDLIRLPDYKQVRAPLSSVIRSRRSVRAYSGKPLSLRELSTILFHGDGVTGALHVDNAPETATLSGTDAIGLRSAASGGALYPVDLYLLVLNVERLSPGAYRYLPKHHALKPVGEVRNKPVVSTLAQFGDIQVDNASVLFVYVYKVFENARKYGEAGLAFAFLEAGAIATNVHLVCTALGLGSCDVGGFSKRGFERLINVDGITRHMIHLTVVGK